MRYLRIENQARYIPSIDYFSTLGLSSSRGNDSSIGQFGTGDKFTLSLFARHGILEQCKRCLGTDVYTYEVRGEATRDGSGRNTLTEKIWMKKQGGGWKDLNIAKEFGEVDWTDFGMGMRELISNALDGADQFDGTYSSFKFEMVDVPDGQKFKWAKDGVIRFYIPLTQQVMNYLLTMPENFICLNDEYKKNETILPNPTQKIGKIFRKGVKVGITGNTWNEYPSLFNYNINNVRLNESRVVDPDHAMADCARHLAAKATLDQAKIYIQEIMVKGREDLYESKFNSYYFDIMQRNHDYGNKEVWTQAIQEVLGNAVIVSDDTQKEMAESRGYKTILITGNMKKEDLKAAGLKDVTDILNYHDLLGQEIVEAPPLVKHRLDFIWSQIEKFHMTGNKTKPEIKCYVQNSLASGASEGYYYKDGTVYVRLDHCEDQGFTLIEIITHELGHHCTDATDGSRTFEGFAYRIAANLLNEKLSQA